MWPGHPATAHWGIEDPAIIKGTDIDKQRAFAMAAHDLRDRIAALISLPITSLDKLALQERLREIDRIEGKFGGSR